jgi:ABC-type nitrate/sulfonate/bicarbonate transport system permease component
MTMTMPDVTSRWLRRFARPIAALAPPAAVFLAALAAAELAVRAGGAPGTIAAPSVIARAVIADRALLWFHLEPTLLTALTGFLLAGAIAVSLALLIYSLAWVETTVVAVATLIDSVPIIAIAPVLTIWIGLSLPMRVTITTIICIFPILISLVQGLKAAPGTARELFSVMAATPLQRFRLLAFPYALPYLFVGLKIAAPVSVFGALIAEWTGAERGLGVFMTNAMSGFLVVDLWASIATSCALSAGFYLLVCAFEYLAIADRGLRQGVGS